MDYQQISATDIFFVWILSFLPAIGVIELKSKTNSNFLQEDPISHPEQYNPGTVNMFQQITAARPQAAQF